MKMRRMAFCLLLIIFVSRIAVAQSPDGLGKAPFGSYFSDNVDTINLYNGNLMLDIPLFSLTGREGMSTGLRLTYNAQGWVDGSTLYSTYGYYVGGWNIVNPLGLPFVETYLTGCDYTYFPYVQPTGYWALDVRWTDPSGAVHTYQNAPGMVLPPEFGGCGEFNWNYWNYNVGSTGWLSTGYPGDSTLAQVGNNGELKIRLAEGRTLSFTFSTFSVETNNGNYQNRDGYTDLLQDQLGRTITLSAGTYSSTEFYRSYTITDANGESRTYQLIYENCHTVHNPVENNTDCIGNLLERIILPNGRSYDFTYGHDQGFLTLVTLPSGGYIEYDYAGGNTGTNSHNINNNYVVARRVSADGSTEAEWTYTRSTSFPNRIVTETRPVANADDYVIVHTFSEGTGYETHTAWKNNANADSSQIVETTRVGGQPTAVVTTIDNLQQQQTFSWSQFRMTESTQSDWYDANTSPAPLTKTVYSYATSFPFQPTQVELQAWNGSTYVTQGKTEFYYDQYSLASVSGTVPNHHSSPPYSSRLNLTTTRRYKDASNYVEEHLYYDVLGNIVERVDARGKSTTLVYGDNYHDNVNRYSYAFPTVVTNAEGHVAATKYNFATGLPVTTADPRSLNTTYTYDLLNRPHTITEPNGHLTTYTYTDDPANTLKVLQEVTVAEGVALKTETRVDRLGRPIRVIQYDPAGEISVDTEYDEIGRVQRVSEPYRIGSPIWTSTAYDVLGRPTMVTNPDSSTITFSYSDNKVTATDEAGIQRRHTSNALGQLVKVEEPNPTLLSPIETTYSYYVFGPLASVTQNDSYYGSQSRSFSSDWLGRITSESHPESGTTSYTYAADGLLETRTDARSITTSYSYDDIGRPLTITYSDSTPDVTFTYDQNNFTGFLSSVDVDGVTASTFEYDNADNLSEENATFDGIIGTFTTAYTYDLARRLRTVTYPSGRVVTQTYASSGSIATDRIADITDSPTSSRIVQEVSDNAAGLLINRTLGGNITETRSFNSRNQLTRISAAANNATLLDMGYSYGPHNTGLIRSRTDATQPEHSAAYTFDKIGRLREVDGGSGSWGLTWGTIDRWGNRRTQTPTGLAVGRVGQPEISYTGNRHDGWTHDDAGNVTDDGPHNYEYDAENRLIQIDSSSTQYAYDAAGRRIRRTANGVTTFYLYGLTGLMSEFSTQSGATEALSTDRLQYRVGEQSGTAVMLIGASGDARENNRVFPFGEPWLSFEASNNIEKFTTYQRDEATGEVGLDYAMARYYAGREGRFMTPDPGHVGANVGDPQSWNAYAYAGNDPINFTDPLGLQQEVLQITIDAKRPEGLFEKIFGFMSGGRVPGFSSRVRLGSCWDDQVECIPDLPATANIFNGMNEAARNLVNSLLGPRPGDCGDPTIPRGGLCVQPPLGAPVILFRLPAGGPGAVIGKLNDLKILTSGERTLLDRLPNLGSPKANWYQNSSVLRREMSLGLPIRDATVDSAGRLINNTGFLRAERNLLETHGWSYNQATRMWYPPVGP